MFNVTTGSVDGADFAYGLGLGWRRSFARAWKLNISITGTHVVTGARHGLTSST
ncbi:MAG: hypothetical protein GVY14_08725 [Spirochaetes bacterium]|nr:hypothetical protein [Spirochaetota bacterium]